MDSWRSEGVFLVPVIVILLLFGAFIGMILYSSPSAVRSAKASIAAMESCAVLCQDATGFEFNSDDGSFSCSCGEE